MIKTGIVSNFSSRTFGICFELRDSDFDIASLIRVIRVIRGKDFLAFSSYQAEATYKGDGFLATTRDLIALEPTTVFKTGESEPRRPVMTWPAE
jgi:hypothetical protein